MEPAHLVPFTTPLPGQQQSGIILQTQREDIVPISRVEERGSAGRENLHPPRERISPVGLLFALLFLGNVRQTATGGSC